MATNPNILKCLTVVQTIELIFLTVMLIATYHSVIYSVWEYREKKTFTEHLKRPLTTADMPTLTVCFEASKKMEYGIDVNVSALSGNSTTLLPPNLIPLTAGKNKYFFGRNRKVYLNQLISTSENQAKVPTEIIGVALHTSCIKMTIKEDLLRTIARRDPLGFFIFTFSDTLDIDYIFSVNFYITTEKNAYGAMFKLWKDGKVEPIILQRGVAHYIRIPQVRAYQYHFAKTCTQVWSYSFSLDTNYHQGHTLIGFGLKHP